MRGLYRLGREAQALRNAWCTPENDDWDHMERTCSFIAPCIMKKATQMGVRMGDTTSVSQKALNVCSYAGCSIVGTHAACSACHSVWYCSKVHTPEIKDIEISCRKAARSFKIQTAHSESQAGPNGIRTINLTRQICKFYRTTNVRIGGRGVTRMPARLSSGDTKTRG